MALILAKGQSNRLSNKNKLAFNGEPMFIVNVKKCLELFPRVYVSSDDIEILKAAERVGAIPIRRGEELCGDTPNIPVYKHAMEHMYTADGIVAVQANSPTVDPLVIKTVKILMQEGRDEVMTCHNDRSIYGSVWALSRKRLENYGDPYKPRPQVMVVDPSVDIHTLEDYNRALAQSLPI